MKQTPSDPRSRWTGALALIAVLGVAARPGEGAERPVRVDESLGISINGLGVQHAVDAQWSRRLGDSTNPLLADRHLAFGASHAITPAYTRLAAWAEVSPLSVFVLRAGAEAATYFGTFGSLQTFRTYGDSFTDEARDASKGQARGGRGSRLFLSPTIRLRAGSIAAVSSADLEWWRVGNSSGPYYYEPARDTLLRAGGDRVLVLSTMVLRLHGQRASGETAYGLRHTLTYVFDAPQNRSQRLGLFLTRPLGIRRLRDRAPRIAGHVSYYLTDPNRRGELSAGLGLSLRLTK
jgi:hypothetical protein